MKVPVGQTQAKIESTNKKKLLKNKFIKIGWCYLFILPQFLFLIIFTFYPIIMSYIYSFFEWSGYGPMSMFVGWQNYIETIYDPLFWNAFKNSFIFMFAVVFIQVPVALLMAILLNYPRLKGLAFYRALYFLPVVTTTAIVGLVMRFIFGAYKGLFNEVLMKLGMITQPIDWLGSVDTALLIVIAVGIWKNIGMTIVYWLGGLQALPKELFEAAKVDGANPFQTLLYISLPLLVPIGSAIVLISAVNGLHMFDLVKSMTGGGPAFRTDMVDVYIYRYAFEGMGEPRVGFASAAGVFYGIAVMGVSLILGFFVRKTGVKKRTM
jgi:ABC-type sugar transport system permease subunit